LTSAASSLDCGSASDSGGSAEKVNENDEPRPSSLLTALGEFDGVTDEVDQHLPQPRDIPYQGLGDAVIDIGADIERLRRRLRSDHLERLLDAAPDREGLPFEVQSAGLDL
jgi:hypothetical protein